DGRGSAASGSGKSKIWVQALLLVAVVVLGCANNISKQIAAKPLQRYTYMLSLATAVCYVPLFGGFLLLLLRLGVVPRFQLRFVWGCKPGHTAAVIFLAMAALGDALGDTIGSICTSHVAGPVHSLLANCTPMFIAVLSICVLGRRYSLFQALSLLGVLLAVVVGVLPSFRGIGSTSGFWAIVLGGSCIFNAVSWVIKEVVFGRYATWLADEGLEDGGSGLNIFVVNAHASLIQLPLTLLLVPLNQVLGETGGEDISSYLREAFSCVLDVPGACGPDSVRPDLAGECVLVYVVFNILWNLSVLLSVKHTGALSTFVALKAIFPLSTLLFAYVDWPLLGPTPLSLLVWLSVALLLPSIGLFQWASHLQAQRAQRHASQASCCWPLGASSLGATPLQSHVECEDQTPWLATR
ncbi:unnamed protein product, partial [Polarella glacialis]